MQLQCSKEKKLPVRLILDRLVGLKGKGFKGKG
jgi:hypothetical protein